MQDAALINRRHLGIIVGLVMGVTLLIVLMLPSSLPWHAPGVMLPGHEALECRECHIEVEGSLRQQLQAQAQYLIGNREHPVNIGHTPVSNADCLACHRRANDNHPVFRFFEPRYKDAREKLAPHRCISCHLEHQGQRVTSTQNFCQQCHGRLEIRNDPIDIPHKQLVADERWESCLGCHDYHGNHQRKAQTQMDQRITPTLIDGYFINGKSPYGENMHYKAKESRYDEAH